MTKRAKNGANGHGFGGSSISICRGPGAELFVEDLAEVELRLVAPLALKCELNSDIVSEGFQVTGGKSKQEWMNLLPFHK